VDPSARIQTDSQKVVQEIAKTIGLEKEQFSEALMAPRPETTSNPGVAERVAFPESSVVRELVPGTNTENFDKIIDQIVKRITLRQNGATFQLGIRLKPEFLGELRIETIMDPDQTIRAVIRAEDSSIKVLLESKIDVLLHKFDEVGIRVDTVEIETLSKDSGSGTDSNNGRSDQSSSHGQNRKAANRTESEVVGQDQESGEENVDDHDDGHIHLFI
jgi:flagellar hook-length control protein FliK